MIKGTTTSGFKFEISEDLFDDFELVELYAKVDKSIIYIGDLAEKLLGVDQKKALAEHVRREDGRVSTTDMIKELTEIEAAIPGSKN